MQTLRKLPKASPKRKAAATPNGKNCSRSVAVKRRGPSLLRFKSALIILRSAKLAAREDSGWNGEPLVQKAQLLGKAQ